MNIAGRSGVGRRVAQGAVLVGFALGIPAAARADDEGRIRKGVELRRQGRDAEALDEFAAADAANSTPETKAQLGLAEQALGRWVAADQHLRQALESPDDPFVQRNQGALRQSLARVSEKVASVELTDAPAGSEVAVDGGPFAPARASYRVVGGHHQFRVRKVGVGEALIESTCLGGEVCREAVTLAPAPAGRTTGPALVAPPLHASRGPAWVRPSGFVLGGVGVLALAGGVVLTGLRSSAVHTATEANGHDRATFDAEFSRAGTYQNGALAAFIGGGILVLGGGLMVFAAPHGSERSAFACRPSLGGAACSGRF